MEDLHGARGEYYYDRDLSLQFHIALPEYLDRQETESPVDNCTEYGMRIGTSKHNTWRKAFPLVTRTIAIPSELDRQTLENEAHPIRNPKYDHHDDNGFEKSSLPRLAHEFEIKDWKVNQIGGMG